MTKKEIGDIPEWKYWRDFPPEWKRHKHDYGYGGVSCKVRSEPWMQNCRFYAHFIDATYIKDVLSLAGISVSKDEQVLIPMGQSSGGNVEWASGKSIVLPRILWLALV